jgi:hypothetical protein
MIGAIVIILLMLYGAYVLTQNGTISVTSMEKVSLLSNQTAFINLYGNSPIAIRLKNTSGTGATFYIARMPLLYGPVASVMLAPYAEANVSSSGTQAADVSIRLLNCSNTGAEIDVVPIPLGIGIKTSPGISLLPPLSFLSQASTANSTTTTTVSTTSTSTSTITTNSTLALFQLALGDMNQTSIGILMKSYKALYIKSAKCNASTYNSTYIAYHTSFPPAPVSFANVSPLTPTNLTISESKATTTNSVLITYSTISGDSSTTGPAVIAIVNTSSISFLRNVSYVGIYRGLNFSILNSSYKFQSKVLNSCGALISPV